MVLILTITVLSYAQTYLWVLLRQSCLQIPQTLCTGNGASIHTDLSNLPFQIGYWTFDDMHGHDYTNNPNPVQGDLTFGPSRFGKGSSLRVESDKTLTIPHIDDYAVNQFTVSFWIFVEELSTGNWRSIIRKGDSATSVSPSIKLWPRQSRLQFKVSTDYFWGEALDSQSIILIRKWTHIAAVASNQLLELYINGNKDSSIVLRGPLHVNNGAWYIGQTNYHQGFNGYLDDLQIFNQALDQSDAASMAHYAQTLLNFPTYILGCQLCNYLNAVNSCNNGYHLCSLQELYYGGYEMARSMGWFRYTGEVWMRNVVGEVNTSSDEMEDPNIFRIAICCMD